MKNNSILIILLVIIFVLVLLVGLFAGYVIAGGVNNSSNLESDTTPAAVGSYKTDSWNGKSAALVIKPDGTCLYPTGDTGTWTLSGNTISIKLTRDNRIHQAEIVPGGVILHEHFFEATP